MAKVDLPTNSITAGAEKKPEKKFEKVTTGRVVTKEKNDIQKVASMFIAEDLRTVRDHIIKDVAVPKLQDFFADLAIATINMIFHGDDRPRGSYSNYAQPSRVSYNRYSNQNTSRQVATPINYQDVIFSSRGDAEEVLNQMADAIATYGSVSVADFYDLVGMTANYTDNKYGWYDLQGRAYVQPISGGYVIRLPKPSTLNN